MSFRGLVKFFERCTGRGEPDAPAARQAADDQEVCVFAGAQMVRQRNLNVKDRPHGTGLLSVSSSQGDQVRSNRVAVIASARSPLRALPLHRPAIAE
jgi:hypothetical protein